MGLDTILDEILELDYDAAMTYFGDDEDFYEEMLKDYAKSDRLDKLENFFAEKNWEQYKVAVHSQKGVSRTLGLLELGDKCEELQHAAEAKDEALIAAKHPIMIADLKKYCDIINQAYN